MRSKLLLLALVAGLILAQLLVEPEALLAAIRTVTDLGDTAPGGAPGQLRFEINAAAPGDTIVIPAGTITLTGAAGEDANASGDLDIFTNLTIQGAGPGVTILDGGGIDRVFQISGVTVTISGMTITGGTVSCTNSGTGECNAVGGGLRNAGTLTVTNSTVSGNTATCTNSGGGNCSGSGAGLSNFGTLTVTNSTASGNTATCTNSGGGVCTAQGGGLFSSSFDTLTITNSTSSGNTATCTNSGGGNSSCFSRGGGLANFGTLTVTNVTVTANTVTCSGAGCTSLGGGLVRSSGTATLQNTIIAKQVAGADCSGAIISNDFNLDSDNTCQLTQPGDKPNVSNPLLGPLANNGGPTQTHALLPGSLAIDGGDNTGCPPIDQRGFGRPVDGDSNGIAICDIGAYEFGAVDPAASAFVTRLYEQVLGREPDAAGLQAFVDQIAQFGSVVPTVLAFFHSEEFLARNTSDAEFLTICYRTFLDREPDPAGFAAFLTALQTGQLTRDNLLDIFIDSQEFAAQASFLPPLDPVTAFVTNLYVRILGRGPDQVGLTGFVTQLNQTRTVLPTVQFFLASPEFLARNTTNTEFVALLYRVFLDRVPDQAGLSIFATQLTNGTATRNQLVLLFAASPEFQAIQHQLFP